MRWVTRILPSAMLGFTSVFGFSAAVPTPMAAADPANPQGWFGSFTSTQNGTNFTQAATWHFNGPDGAVTVDATYASHVVTETQFCIFDVTVTGSAVGLPAGDTSALQVVNADDGMALQPGVAATYVIGSGLIVGPFTGFYSQLITEKEEGGDFCADSDSGAYPIAGWAAAMPPGGQTFDAAAGWTALTDGFSDGPFVVSWSLSMSSDGADSDGDGVPDSDDLCPGTPPGVPVAGNGCPDGDADGDGVLDADDLCPGTPPGDPVDATGCSIPDPDDDGDGLSNSMEEGLHTNPDDRDTDHDGVDDRTEVLQDSDPLDINSPSAFPVEQFDRRLCNRTTSCEVYTEFYKAGVLLSNDDLLTVANELNGLAFKALAACFIEPVARAIMGVVGVSATLNSGAAGWQLATDDAIEDVEWASVKGWFGATPPCQLPQQQLPFSFTPPQFDFDRGDSVFSQAYRAIFKVIDQLFVPVEARVITVQVDRIAREPARPDMCHMVMTVGFEEVLDLVYWAQGAGDRECIPNGAWKDLNPNPPAPSSGGGGGGSS